MPAYDYAMTQAWTLAGQPIREQILAALLARAQTYVPTATRDPVRRDERNLPRLVLQDLTETKASPIAYKKHHLTLNLAASMADAIGPATDTLAHRANLHVAGIIAAICGTDITLGGLCDAVEYETSTIQYPDPGDIVVGVSVQFSVRYTVALGDPFTR